MSAETRKVLEMLAEGKITSDDAERLLDKLAAVKEPAEGNGEARQEGPSTSKGGQRFLRIVVTRDLQGHDVNMRKARGGTIEGEASMGDGMRLDRDHVS